MTRDSLQLNDAGRTSSISHVVGREAEVLKKKWFVSVKRAAWWQRFSAPPDPEHSHRMKPVHQKERHLTIFFFGTKNKKFFHLYLSISDYSFYT